MAIHCPPSQIRDLDLDLDNDAQPAGSGFDSQDDLQSAIQPSMSAAAAHLTCSNAGEDEKLAALRKRPTGDSSYFSKPFEDDDSDPNSSSGEGSGESTPAEGRTPSAELRPGPSSRRERSRMSLGTLPDQKLTKETPLPWPSPWTSGPRDLIIDTSAVTDGGRPPRPSSGILDSAFSITSDQKQSRQTTRRSGSVGQEAFKRLREAMFSPTQLHFHMLPSFHGGSFWPNSNRSSPTLGNGDEDKSSGKSSRSPLTPPAWSLRRKPLPRNASMDAGSKLGPDSPKDTAGLQHDQEARGAAGLTPLKTGGLLRRVASDESILYHKLSPQSSLDDGKFDDVHEMVNMRLMALKDSLPSLPKVNAPWLSSLNLSNTLNDGEPPAAAIKRPFAGSVPGDPSSHATVASEATETSSAGKDELDRALEHLTGDIVVLGGYRGSVLRSAEPPYQQLWAPVKVGLNLRKVNLEVGLSDAEEVAASKTVRPSGMLKNIGPVDISRKFIRRLRTCENARSGRLRVWDYGYDWRLSPHRLSLGLCEFLSRLPSNQQGVPPESRGALVVAHSLGGLITRHAVNQQPHLFSGVLFAGTPQSTINILGPLRTGDAVLFNDKLLTAAVNFSIRTSFVFLPEDGFAYVDKETGESYIVDFYNADDWARCKLSPCVGGPSRPSSLRPHSSSFSSLLPSSFRSRRDSKTDKDKATKEADRGVQPLDQTLAPQMSTKLHPDAAAKDGSAAGCEDPEKRQRYTEYLTRTLARTKRFRAELQHSSSKQEANVYPPLAVLYSKSVPTVYAAQVRGREGIASAEVHDDLLFRAGDGVTLAKQAMLPPGYHVVKGGKVQTERGHITLLGDMPAVGKALGALARGREKGIGLGEGMRRPTREAGQLDGHKRG